MGNLKWPEGKKCAVMFTFDVDGDTTWENGNRGLPNGEKYTRIPSFSRRFLKRSALSWPEYCVMHTLPT